MCLNICLMAVLKKQWENGHHSQRQEEIIVKIWGQQQIFFQSSFVSLKCCNSFGKIIGKKNDRSCCTRDQRLIGRGKKTQFQQHPQPIVGWNLIPKTVRVEEFQNSSTTTKCFTGADRTLNRQTLLTVDGLDNRSVGGANIKMLHGLWNISAFHVKSLLLSQANLLFLPFRSREPEAFKRRLWPWNRPRFH